MYRYRDYLEVEPGVAVAVVGVVLIFNLRVKITVTDQWNRREATKNNVQLPSFQEVSSPILRVARGFLAGCSPAS